MNKYNQITKPALAPLIFLIPSAAFSLRPYLSMIPITTSVVKNKLIYLFSINPLPIISKISTIPFPPARPVATPEINTTEITSSLSTKPTTIITIPIKTK